MRARHMLLLSMVLLGCAASSGSRGWATRLVPAKRGAKLEPGPPEDVRWLRVVSAVIPTRTEAGDLWDSGGGRPDAYVVLRINGSIAMRTSTVEDSLTPRWPKDASGNFALAPGDKLEVELYDDDVMQSLPIGRTIVGHEDLVPGTATLTIAHATKVVLQVDHAHAFIGLGFDYKVASHEVAVHRVMRYAPAARAGMRPSDRIVTIAGKRANSLAPSEIDGILSAVPKGGLQIIVRHPGGRTQTLRMQEGPSYPLFDEVGSID